MFVYNEFYLKVYAVKRVNTESCINSLEAEDDILTKFYSDYPHYSSGLQDVATICSKMGDTVDLFSTKVINPPGLFECRESMVWSLLNLHLSMSLVEVFGYNVIVSIIGRGSEDIEFSKFLSGLDKGRLAGLNCLIQKILSPDSRTFINISTEDHGGYRLAFKSNAHISPIAVSALLLLFRLLIKIPDSFMHPDSVIPSEINNIVLSNVIKSLNDKLYDMVKPGFGPARGLIGILSLITYLQSKNGLRIPDNRETTLGYNGPLTLMMSERSWTVSQWNTYIRKYILPDHINKYVSLLDECVNFKIAYKLYEKGEL